MRLTASKIRLQFNENMQPEIILTTQKSYLSEEYNKLVEAVANNKKLDAEIKVHRERRSLDANSYAWVLISQMAEVLRTDKETVYLDMLEHYGQREPQLLSVIAEGVDAIYRATKNHCCEVGESELNGKLFKHIAILRGSSEYNTKEMSVLIDGVVSECKELGIETLTPKELALLKQDWGKQNESNK